MSEHRQFEVLIVGGGPAGIAAAVRAAESGLRVGIVDDNPALGGQIWRGEEAQGRAHSAEWYKRVSRQNIDHLRGFRVFGHGDQRTLLAESVDGVHELRFEHLVIATGARECFLPFPGWTLPNVVGVGGLQALVRSGVPISGRKVVVAGTGPLLLAVAAHLREYGAEICLIAEQAPAMRLLGFGATLLSYPSKLMQAVWFRRELAGVPLKTSCWPVSANGTDKVESVTLLSGSKTWQVQCDYLACGFHLVPNTELATLLGCDVKDGAVVVDTLQRTSVNDLYCAGEPTGVGGVELSLVEGEIAGYAVAGKMHDAEQLFARRNKYRDFAARMSRAFALNPELRTLPQPETLVCRCEDVSLALLKEHSSWRSAKLHTRCGMGPCQGRVCGPAVQFLLGWTPQSVRPPIFPVRLESLAAIAGEKNVG